jgi:hypothetical protein
MARPRYREASPAAGGGEPCVTCGATLRGEYCHACGEKRRSEQDLTLAAFGRYAVEAATNADAKLYVTVRALVSRPGLLTREFVAGRRRPWIGPLQLFLAANLLFFLLLQLGWGTNAFTTDLVHHAGQPIYGEIAREWIEERVGPLPERPAGMTFPGWLGQMSEEQRQLRERFNEAAPRYANSLVVIMVPLLAIGFRLLRVRAVFVRELVFSLHFFSFLLLVLIVLPALFRAGGFLPMRYHRIMDSEEATVLLLAALVWSYTAIALRTSHADRWPAALLRGALAPVVLFIVVTLYRAVLFFVVFAAV